MIEYRNDEDFHYENINNKKKMLLLANSIQNEVQNSAFRMGGNARFNYRLYKSEKEKDEYSVIRLNKFRNKLGKCKGVIAVQLTESMVYFGNDIKFNALLYIIKEHLYDYIEDWQFEDLPISHFKKYKTFVKHSKQKNLHLKKFVKYLKLLNEYLSCLSMVESIELDKKEDNGITGSDENKNPYPRIFCNDYAFRIFKRTKKYVKNPLADYSFFYRKMIEDKLIFESVGESEFRTWLSSEYEVEIDKMKQLHICSTQSKEQFYSTIKDIVKAD